MYPDQAEFEFMKKEVRKADLLKQAILEVIEKPEWFDSPCAREIRRVMTEIANGEDNNEA